MLEIFYSTKNIFGKQKTKSFTIAEEWNELSAKQLLKVANVLHANLTAEQFNLKCLQALSNISIYQFFKLPTDVKLKCYQYVNWLNNDTKQFTKQVFTTYKSLAAPADDFDNLTMLEFHYTELAYQNLISTNEIDYLNEIVAILFRPIKNNYNIQHNPDGDARVKFNPNVVASNKKRVAKFSLDFKHAVLLWYDGCRQNLIASYEPLYAGTNKTDDFSVGLYKMMRSVAGDKYGTIAEVENLNIHTAHVELMCMMEDAQEIINQQSNGSI